ncbi:MAG: hypothetical protein U5K00_12680 [Melioribacteraceae bacterium]|nr:hypothetical protein [Melioribacteraceae bacterium]
MKKILISDKIHPNCINHLKENSFTVEYNPDLSKDELLNSIKDYNGLIVRSSTQVTQEIIEAAGNLEIIGRARNRY